MNRARILSAGSAILALMVCPDVGAQQDACSKIIGGFDPSDWAACTAPAQFNPKSRSGSDAPIEAVMRFRSTVRNIGGNQRCQVIPTLQTFSKANSVFSNMLKMFPPSVAGHDILDPTVTNISFVDANKEGGFSAANVEGRLTVRKRAIYNYPCIDGWTLKWCEGWTLLYQFEAGWSATIRPKGVPYSSASFVDPDYTHSTLPDGNVSFALVSKPSSASPFRASQNAFSIDVPKGSTNFQVDVSNDLVRLAEALTRVFGEYLRLINIGFYGIIQLNYDQFRKFDIGTLAANAGQEISSANEINFVQQVLDQVGDRTARHTSGTGKAENTALDAILNSFVGGDADFRNSTYKGTAGQWVSIKYVVRPENLMDRIYAGGNSVEPLSPRLFCAQTKKDLVADLRQILEGTDDDKALVESRYPWRKFEKEGKSLFAKGDLARSIQSYRASAGLKDTEPVTRLGVLKFFLNRIVARNFSNYETLTKFYNLRGDERACIRSRIIKTSGDLSLIYPGQDFTDCVQDGPILNEEQEARLSEIDLSLSASGFWAGKKDGAAPPIPPTTNAQPRGWYYCYLTPDCGEVGESILLWDPTASLFGGRASRNAGVDVFSADHINGSSNLVAIADGPVFFGSVNGWGNLLVLPFMSSGHSYFAVYSGLPKTASGFDKNSVRQGDSLGMTGCTGPSSRPDGMCNSYCKVGDVFHTDESLHFEIIERLGPSAFQPVDPTTVIQGWKLEMDLSGQGKKVCTECKDNTCAPVPMQNTSNATKH